MRDKYSFVPDPVAPPSHHGRRDEISALFGINKNMRKRHSTEAANALAQNLAVAADFNAIHTALHTYEKAHLNGGGNWPRLKGALLLRYRGVLDFVDNLPHSSDCFMRVGGIRAKVGTVFFGEGRFHLIGRPLLAHNDVYHRHGDNNVPPRHYISLTTSATHVKRFVTRGLSAFDAMAITQGRPLRSVLGTVNAQLTEVGGAFMHGVGAGIALTEAQQILTHTRGWGGNKRYISTGVSNRPALSTRGIPFVSMYGVVTVDLALVPAATIFDVHRHDVASAWLGLPATDVLNNGHHTNTGDIAEQQYLGLRDTIRTRELLIKGSIPIAALHRTSAGRVLLGLGSTTNLMHDGHARRKVNGFGDGGTEHLISTLAPGIRGTIVGQDHMSFRDPHTNLRWHFLEFNAPGAVVAAQLVLQPLLAGRNMVAFEKFTPIRPPGMV